MLKNLSQGLTIEPSKVFIEVPGLRSPKPTTADD